MNRFNYDDENDDDFETFQKKPIIKKMKSSKLSELNENKRKNKFKTKTFRKYNKNNDE